MEIIINQTDTIKEKKSKDLGNGIKLNIGKPEMEESTLVYSVEFDESWTKEKADDWLNEHKEQFAKSKKTKSISGVEIFAAGTWNGDEYSTDDLDQMVKAFNENKETVRPYLKLGHDNDQKLLQKDGYPSAGWISDIRRVGEKLIADFKEVPEKVYELIKNGAYKKVSSEIYWNIKIGKQLYRKLLSGVALLGSDMPAVSSLDDILSFYGINAFENLKSYSENNDIKEYIIAKEAFVNNEQIEKLESEVKEYKTKLEESNKASEELKSKYSETEALLKKHQDDLAKIAQEKAQVELEQAVDKMEAMTPAMRPYVLAFLTEDKKEYTVKGNDEKEKTVSKIELFAEILNLAKASTVNFAESSDKGKKQDDNKEAQVEKEIEKYQEENKCSYKEAYKAVMKSKK